MSLAATRKGRTGKRELSSRELGKTSQGWSATLRVQELPQYASPAEPPTHRSFQSSDAARAFQLGRPWPGPRTSRTESVTQVKSPQRNIRLQCRKCDANGRYKSDDAVNLHGCVNRKSTMHRIERTVHGNDATNYVSKITTPKNRRRVLEHEKELETA